MLVIPGEIPGKAPIYQATVAVQSEASVLEDVHLEFMAHSKLGERELEVRAILEPLRVPWMHHHDIILGVRGPEVLH